MGGTTAAGAAARWRAPGAVLAAVLLAGGCATVSVRESGNLKRYPAASGTPHLESWRGSCGPARMTIELGREMRRQGFYKIGSIAATYKGDKGAEACAALRAKAQEAGANILVVGGGGVATKYVAPDPMYRYDYSRGKMVPNFGRNPLGRTEMVGMTLDADLYVYDPNRSRGEMLAAVFEEIKNVEGEDGYFTGLRNPKAYRKPGLQAIWRRELSELKTAVARGSFAEAAEKAGTFLTRVDGCIKNTVKYKPDDDDWVLDCKLQNPPFFAFEKIMNSLIDITEIKPANRKDFDTALKLFVRKANLAEEERSAAGREKHKILLAKWSAVEKTLSGCDNSAFIADKKWLFMTYAEETGRLLRELSRYKAEEYMSLMIFMQEREMADGPKKREVEGLLKDAREYLKTHMVELVLWEGSK